MLKLLVLLFIIKLYAHIIIYKHIEKKHEQDIIKIVRLYKKLESKYVKLKDDIDFTKCCKWETIILIFAKVKKRWIQTNKEDKYVGNRHRIS